MLIVSAYQKLGEWQLSIENLDEVVIPEIMKSLKIAIDLDPNWYKAWHSWSMVNYEVVSYYEKLLQNSITQATSTTKDQSKDFYSQLQSHLIPAIKGFFRSIILSPGLSLQDTLRLLTLWFKYGNQKEVETTLLEGFDNVPVDTWLQVIPQVN